MNPGYIPDQHSAVSPYFVVADAGGLIEFLRRAFDAEEKFRSARPDGAIMHAELVIDGSVVMVGQREEGYRNSTHLYVKDVDATYRRCLELGAESVAAPETRPYGDRSSGVRDPFGNTWWIGTHLRK